MNARGESLEEFVEATILPSYVEITNEENVCRKPTAIKTLLSARKGTDALVIIGEILQELIKKLLPGSPLVMIKGSKLLEKVFEGIESNNSDIGKDLYELLRLAKIQLTGKNRINKIKDDVIKQVLNVDSSFEVDIPEDFSEYAKKLKALLARLGFEIIEIDSSKEADEAIASVSESIPENVLALANQAFEGVDNKNMEELQIQLETPSSISEEICLVTMICVLKKKIEWSEISKQSQVIILKTLLSKDVSYVKSGISIPFGLLSNDEIVKTIVDHDELWDLFVSSKSLNMQYLALLLIQTEKGKERFKNASEFEKVLKTDNYEFIWQVLSVISRKEPCSNDVLNKTMSLFKNIRFLRKGLSLQSSAESTTYLESFVRQNANFFISKLYTESWSVIFEDDSVLYTVLSTLLNEGTKKTILAKLDIDDLIKRSMKKTVRWYLKVSSKLDMVRNLKFAKKLAVHGFYDILSDWVQSFDDKDLTAWMPENNNNDSSQKDVLAFYLKGFCSIAPLLKNKVIVKTIQSDQYLRSLAVQNLSCSDLEVLTDFTIHNKIESLNDSEKIICNDLYEQIKKGYKVKVTELVTFLNLDSWFVLFLNKLATLKVNTTTRPTVCIQESRNEENRDSSAIKEQEGSAKVTTTNGVQVFTGAAIREYWENRTQEEEVAQRKALEAKEQQRVREESREEIIKEVDKLKIDLEYIILLINVDIQSLGTVRFYHRDKKRQKSIFEQQIAEMQQKITQIDAILTRLKSDDYSEEDFRKMNEEITTISGELTMQESWTNRLKFIKKLEEDHSDSQLTVKFFELDELAADPQPTWEEIKARLTPEILDRIAHLHKPKLICVPTRDKNNRPITFQELGQALDQARRAGKTSKVQVFNTWSQIRNRNNVRYKNANGKFVSQQEYFSSLPSWQVWVIEGAAEVPRPDQLSSEHFKDFPILGTNRAKHNYMVKKFKKLKLEGLTYETWIILLMDYLRRQEKIDIRSYTDLLNNELAIKRLFAIARWYGYGPFLTYENNFDNKRDGHWCSRGAVRAM